MVYFPRIAEDLMGSQQEYQRLKANAESTWRQFMWAIERKFDPDQPRDELGRWIDAGSFESNTSASDRGATDFSAARRGQSEAVCWSQYQVDMLRCQAELRATARAICRAQAMERYAACRSGNPIPPLIF